VKIGKVNENGTLPAKELTMAVPKEWSDKYGQLENTEVNLSDNAGYKIVDGMVKAWGKTAKDLEKAQEEFRKFREGMEKNHIDAMHKQAQERLETQRRHTQMLHAMETAAKTKQLGILDIETDAVIKEAQLDAVLGSRFASPEQKMYAKMEKEALAEQADISLKYNEKRNEMVETGNLAPATEQEKAELDAKYKEQDDTALQEAKGKYEETRQKNVDGEMATYMEDWRQRKAEAMEKATTGGLFGIKGSRPYGGDPGNVHTVFAREFDEKSKEIREKSHTDFTKSDEYKEYRKGAAERGKAKQEELDGLNNRKEVRKRADIEGRAIDHQEAVEKAQSALKFEERKRAVQAAMQLPVRSNLEESYNMVNDELIKQGESLRLGGSSEVAKVVDESIKPALEKLDRHYEKLERVLQSGEVRAIVQVKV